MVLTLVAFFSSVKFNISVIEVIWWNCVLPLHRLLIVCCSLFIERQTGEQPCTSLNDDDDDRRDGEFIPVSLRCNSGTFLRIFVRR